MRPCNREWEIPRKALADRLEHALITAQNDDLSKPMSEKRERHSTRQETIRDVLEYLRSPLPGTREEVARVEMQMAQLHAEKDMEIARLLDLLERAKPHVKASRGADHMMEGFGPRKTYPSDVLLADIETALSGLAALPSAPMATLTVERPISERLTATSGPEDGDVTSRERPALNSPPERDWPETTITNPDIADPTGVPYIDGLIHRLLDAQQDIKLEANESMSQSLSDASALCDEIETALRTAAGQKPMPEREGMRAALEATLITELVEWMRLAADRRVSSEAIGIRVRNALPSYRAALAPHDKTEGSVQLLSIVVPSDIDNAPIEPDGPIGLYHIRFNHSEWSTIFESRSLAILDGQELVLRRNGREIGVFRRK